MVPDELFFATRANARAYTMRASWQQLVRGNMFQSFTLSLTPWHPPKGLYGYGVKSNVQAASVKCKIQKIKLDKMINREQILIMLNDGNRVIKLISSNCG